MTQTILIIDDEADIRDLLADIFADEGYHVIKAAHSEQALSVLCDHAVDLIVLDIWLDNSDMDGMQILKYLKKQEAMQNIPVLMISGHGNIEMAVNAMKVGAFDFVEKPFQIDHILLTVKRALEQKSLHEENMRLRQAEGNSSLHPLQAYKSTAMVNFLKVIEEHSPSDARIMIQGDRGTGKTHWAKIIHKKSPRHHHKCILMNAYTAKPEAIDTALQDAGQGTLVIENIEFLAAEAQSALLSSLAKNGLSCRLLTTCGASLPEKIAQGDFSSALYDRLSIVTVAVPCLAQRLDDLEILIQNFSHHLCNEFHHSPMTLCPDTVQMLKHRPWPGNVRQLKTAVEWHCMAMLFDDQTLSVMSGNNDNNVPSVQPSQAAPYTNYSLKQARELFEKDYLNDILHRYDGNIAKVADYIEMERTALYRKLKSLDLSYEQKIEANA